jgi:hypothetical protein
LPYVTVKGGEVSVFIIILAYGEYLLVLVIKCGKAADHLLDFKTNIRTPNLKATVEKKW